MVKILDEVGVAAIDPIYRRLLVAKRQIELQEAHAETLCVCCERPLSEHLGDKRCNIYATSRDFTSVDGPDMVRIVAALVHLEELQSLHRES